MPSPDPFSPPPIAMALVAVLLGGWLAWTGAAQLRESLSSPDGRFAGRCAGVRILAVLEIVLGAALLTAGGLLGLYGPERVGDYLRLRPGWLVLAAGLAVLRGGLRAMVACQAAPCGALSAWLNRGHGLPALLLGAVLIAGGAADVLFPGAVLALAARLVGGAP
jgi:hypothetical protein